MGMDKYALLGELAEYSKPETAWKACHAMLTENPNDARALVAAAVIMCKLGALPQAYHFARSATELSPNEPLAWINYGHAAAELWLVKEAESYYQKALLLSTREDTKLASLLNLGALYVDNGLFDRGEAVTKEILKCDPTHTKALSNLGLCKLARHDWSGWEGYRLLIGSPLRVRVKYKEEPEWDGTPGKNVVIYAEQGIGDEVSFASMIPDAAKVCRKLIFDCDGRLEGLFRRSFPNVTVYGTRIKETKWAKQDRAIDASLPVGQLGEYFRTTSSAFTGTPYLKPCPVRLRQWNSILRRPTIGIAWTGGISRTNARNRRVSLEDLLPVLSLDADFVSLQYKDASDEIAAFHVKHPEISLKQYPWATLTNDYDDTAALVASLDYVCCIQTAVAHLAGGLGVPATVLVPKATTWRYGLEGNTIPWYRSLRVIRQHKDTEWHDEIKRAAEHIGDYLGRLPRGAREAAREGELWDGIDRLRPGGLRNSRAHGDYPSARLRVRSDVQPGEAPEGQDRAAVPGL
jgi:tetratricopeptide (TPR) repeat protein